MSEPRPHEQADLSEPGLLAERQRRVEALADEYLEGLIAGQAPDRQAVLAAHPDLADLLEPRLALVELMHRVARAERPGSETASLAPPGAPAERVLSVKCPHCGNGIRLVEPAPADVTCGGCGSSFHLNLRATTSFSPAALPRSVGKFEVLEQLGRGAFGTVYKARDPDLRRLVAVKVPRAGSFATPEEEERFLREARAAAQLSHPGIVPVLEVAHDRGVPYIVSEYVDGLTLADVLTARRPGFREAAELVAAAADALDCAHRRQIVHRDVKPSNLLIDAAGRPHVTDFGLARRGEGEITVTLDGQILGTPAYMAPEQAAGDQQRVDARSDVYSLGVVLYELLTGELPFRGNQRMLLHQVLHDEPRPPRSLNDRVPRDLETVCLKAMAKAPGRRYASALELADDLRRFLKGEPIRARRVGRPEKLTRWARRNPVVAGLTTAVALLLLTATAVAISFALYQRQVSRELADEKVKAERSQREAELRAASAAVDLDLKYCENVEVEYGVLRLARTLGTLPPHATELRQCVEMNLLAWAQQVRRLGPIFQYDGAETTSELSPDGLTVLTGGADGTARLWDASTGEVRATLRGHRGKIASVAFSRNGRVAMTVGEDKTVRLWQASNGEARGVTAGHPKGIANAWLSPDGRRLLTLGRDVRSSLSYAPGVQGDTTATLWDAATGRRIGELAGHEGPIHDAAFGPDAETVLTGGADGTARLWSAENGRLLATLEGHAGAVVKVAFSPDGSSVATLAREPGLGRVRWWATRGFRQIGPPCTSPGIPQVSPLGFHFIGRDVVALDGSIGMAPIPGECFIPGRESSVSFPGTPLAACRADDDCVIDSQGRVYDRKTGNHRPAGTGRRFGDELARFATDGRFLILDDLLVDLRTEKPIGRGRSADQYVPDRQTFVGLGTYVPWPSAALDDEVARLFAEVVTCQDLDPAGSTRPLDEATWDERRQQLARRLGEHPAPLPVRRLAADPWYWLRWRADRAKTEEERVKYLDRLIAAEPAWQNFDRRALAHRQLKHRAEEARDFLEAARRAGEGYWHQPRIEGVLEGECVALATSNPEEQQLGLRLAEALSHAEPEDHDRRILLPIAHYRLGHYAEALSLLETWQRERERAVVSQVGEFFMTPFPVSFPHRESVGHDVIEAQALLAMTYHRLGHADQAWAVLADLRTMGDSLTPLSYGLDRWKESKDYADLLREAEALIEGRPPAGK